MANGFFDKMGTGQTTFETRQQAARPFSRGGYREALATLGNRRALSGLAQLARPETIEGFRDDAKMMQAKRMTEEAARQLPPDATQDQKLEVIQRSFEAVGLPQKSLEVQAKRDEMRASQAAASLQAKKTQAEIGEIGAKTEKAKAEALTEPAKRDKLLSEAGLNEYKAEYYGARAGLTRNQAGEAYQRILNVATGVTAIGNLSPKERLIGVASGDTEFLKKMMPGIPLSQATVESMRQDAEAQLESAITKNSGKFTMPSDNQIKAMATSILLGKGEDEFSMIENTPDTMEGSGGQLDDPTLLNAVWPKAKEMVRQAKGDMDLPTAIKKAIAEETGEGGGSFDDLWNYTE